MTRLRTVVVGTDGSDSALSALGWAVTHFGDAELHVVYAHHDRDDPNRTDRGEGGAPQSTNIEWQLAGEWTEPVRQAGSEATRHLGDGDPAAELIRVAEEVGADTIVIGAHGSGDKPSHYLGSITRRLLHDSSIPVIVVSRHASDQPKVGRVIACVGYGDTAARAAEWGAAYADDRGLPLTLLHVISHRPLFPLDSPVDMVGSYLGSDISGDWAQSELDTLRDELVLRHPDLDITTVVEHGSAVESVLDASAPADLVVVGKRHEGIVSRHLIGPRLQRLVARGVSPTAVVPSCFEAS